MCHAPKMYLFEKAAESVTAQRLILLSSLANYRAGGAYRLPAVSRRHFSHGRISLSSSLGNHHSNCNTSKA